jgi:hypothetical protein
LLALPDVVQLLWVVEAVQVLLVEAWAEESQSIQRDSLMSFALLHCFRHAPFFILFLSSHFSGKEERNQRLRSLQNHKTVTTTESQTKQLSALKLDVNTAVKHDRNKRI